MVKVYGIPNCDIVKKATRWLVKNKIPFELHDYKKSGINKQKLSSWIKSVGWESIFNKRSSTWRALHTHTGINVGDEQGAVDILTEHTSIIKRPIVEVGKELIVGFDEQEYIAKILNKS